MPENIPAKELTMAQEESIAMPSCLYTYNTRNWIYKSMSVKVYFTESLLTLEGRILFY